MNRTLRLYDPALFWLAMAATLLGLLFVFDAGYARSLATGKGPIPREFIMQLVFTPLAVFASVWCAGIKPERWKTISKILWWASFVGLLLCMAPVIGVAMNGAHRWVKLGPIVLQPAEFVKLTAVLYLAGQFADRKEWPANIKYKDWTQWADRVLLPKLVRFGPMLAVLIAVILIEKEPDMGTGAVVAFTAFCMMILGGVSKKSILLATVLSLLGVMLMIKAEPYRLERITNHSKRWEAGTMDDTGYQTVQSEVAMASGGFFGTGPGSGRAKHVQPAATTDFLPSTIGEEFGLVGMLFTLSVLCMLCLRMLALAAKAPTKFGSMVLSGCSAWIGIQACVNIMMANGFLPAIGIPLPFISSGGSSLIALWMAVGVCQSVIAPQTVEEENVAPNRHRRWHRRSRLSRA